MEDVHHDGFQLGVHLVEGPAHALGVLAHFQRGGGYAAGVARLAGAEENAALLEVFRGVQGGGHIGALGHGEAASGHQRFRVLQEQLVLGGAGQSHVALGAPHAPALVIDAVGPGLGVLGQPGAADLLDFDEGRHVNAVGIVDPAGGVGTGDGLGPQLPGLLDGVGGHIARAGDGHGLALQGLAVAAEHLLHKVQQAIARGLGPGQGAAEAQALAREDALIAVLQALVLAEEVAHLPGAHADIPGGHVGIRADVAEELGHKALAEGHDLPVGLALGVEVGAALAAADGQAGEAVFKGLLKAQEFDDPQVDGGVEAKSALIRPDGAVELDPVAVVDLDLALVVHPGHPEQDAPLGGGQPLKKGIFAITLFIFFDHGPKRFQNLIDCLLKFRLVGVLLFDPI